MSKEFGSEESYLNQRPMSSAAYDIYKVNQKRFRGFARKSAVEERIQILAFPTLIHVASRSESVTKPNDGNFDDLSPARHHHTQ
jgi:hypothetical protein